MAGKPPVDVFFRGFFPKNRRNREIGKQPQPEFGPKRGAPCFSPHLQIITIPIEYSDYADKGDLAVALNKEHIIEEALSLLDAHGIEGVTLRKLAARLNVQAPALYWHFKNKAALVHAMAEAILQTEFSVIPPPAEGETWQSWLTGLFRLLRKAMLSRTDGGRIIAGAHLSLTMARFSETTIDTLCRAGIPLREARLMVLTATHFTFGHAIVEQTPLPPEGAEAFDLEQFSKNYPTVVAGIEEYFVASNHTVDDLFNDGLALIIGRQ